MNMIEYDIDLRDVFKELLFKDITGVPYGLATAPNCPRPVKRLIDASYKEFCRSNIRAKKKHMKKSKYRKGNK